MRLNEVDAFNYVSEIPQLGRMLGSVFYVLWREDYGNSEAAVRDYLDGVDEEFREALAREIREVLSVAGEDDLRALFKRLQAGVNPLIESPSYHLWLEKIASIIDAEWE